MDTSKIKNIQIEDIDYRDYPDFCDAYISEAEWEDGTPLTEDELMELNSEHGDFVYDCVINKIY